MEPIPVDPLEPEFKGPEPLPLDPATTSEVAHTQAVRLTYSPDTLQEREDACVLETQGATIVILPGVTLGREAFVSQTPAGSISVDGLVNSKVGPFSDGETGHYNFDHHNQDRSFLMSSCKQVYERIKRGFVSEELAVRGLKPIVYVNELDHDTLTVLRVIAYAHLYERQQSRTEDIVNIADAFDRNLGFYPHPLSDPLLKEFAAIFATYFDIRAELPYVSPRLWAATIEAVFLRFDLFEAGRLEVEQTLCTDYVNVKELYPDLPDPQGFVFFSKESPFTRTSLFEQKYSDYAYLLGADGKSFRYSHGKIAPSSTFPLADFALVLNEVERSLGTAITLSGESVDAEINAWGGDDMTGGSPRGTGSALPPHDYVHLRNAFSSYTGAGRGKYDPVKLPLFIREELPKLVVR